MKRSILFITLATLTLLCYSQKNQNTCLLIHLDSGAKHKSANELKTELSKYFNDTSNIIFGYQIRTRSNQYLFGASLNSDTSIDIVSIKRELLDTSFSYSSIPRVDLDKLNSLKRKSYRGDYNCPCMFNQGSMSIDGVGLTFWFYEGHNTIIETTNFFLMKRELKSKSSFFRLQNELLSLFGE